LDTYKPILLNVPLGLLQRLNQASAAMRISRSALIRRCLSRDLEFVLRCELSHLAEANEQSALDYFRWVENIV
jgi:hypothetical protein